MVGVFVLKLFCLPSKYGNRKYNARNFDKSKSANLLKILKGEHPPKKWQNCGTEVLCAMIFMILLSWQKVLTQFLVMNVFVTTFVCFVFKECTQRNHTVHLILL